MSNCRPVTLPFLVDGGARASACRCVCLGYGAGVVPFDSCSYAVKLARISASSLTRAILERCMNVPQEKGGNDACVREYQNQKVGRLVVAKTRRFLVSSLLRTFCSSRLRNVSKPSSEIKGAMREDAIQ